MQLTPFQHKQPKIGCAQQQSLLELGFDVPCVILQRKADVGQDPSIQPATLRRDASAVDKNKKQHYRIKATDYL